MDLKTKEKYTLKNPKTIAEERRAIASKKSVGSVAAYYQNTGTSLLQEMFYTNIEERKAAVKKLLGIWGGSISFFQICPGKKKTTPVTID